jgi:hypothetical protein
MVIVFSYRIDWNIRRIISYAEKSIWCAAKKGERTVESVGKREISAEDSVEKPPEEPRIPKCGLSD